MIDCGGTSNFMDIDYAKANSVPLVKKLVPHQLEVVDGHPISSSAVTHQTSDLLLSTNSHHETISFDITKLGHYPIILGLPWLKRHNPSIDWSLH